MGFIRRICIVALVGASSLVHSQSIPSVEAKSLEKPPTIDGSINPDEWSSATAFSGLVDLSTGAPADNGEFWIGHDSKFVYFAARLADPSPSSIRAVEYRTNVGLGGDDNVKLWLEPAGAGEAYNIFTMNAAGGSNLQIAGGRAIKREWLGEFMTKGRVTESGWEVEARIPWQIMQLPAPGRRSAKFNVLRYTTRTQRDTAWAYQGGPGLYYGRLNNLEIPKTKFEPTLKLLPYGFGGLEDGGEFQTSFGMDFKTSLTSTIEAVGTINPDFRNIENDILSLDFSYLERLPDDSRPFFQEGAEYYGSLLFASQRIGKFDTGFNVYGKLNDKLNFGALTAQTFGDESATVATATYQFDPKHLMRVSGTSLQSDLRPDNDAMLVRWVERFDEFGYGLRYVKTEDQLVGSGEGWDFNGGYQKGNFSGYFNYYDIGENLMPRLGFVPERDYRGFNGGGSYTGFLKKGPLMEWGVEGGFADFDHQDGSYYRKEAYVATSATLRDGTDIDFFVQKAGFEKNRDTIYFASIEKPRGDSYRRWQIDHMWGEIAGRDYRSTSITVLYRPLPKLQMALRHQSVRHFENNDQSILSANFDMGRDQSISGRFVHRDGRNSGYVSWRKSGNRGNEYYVIVGDPNSASFKSSVILKVVMPFEIKF